MNANEIDRDIVDSRQKERTEGEERRRRRYSYRKEKWDSKESEDFADFVRGIGVITVMSLFGFSFLSFVVNSSVRACNVTTTFTDFVFRCTNRALYA